MIMSVKDQFYQIILPFYRLKKSETVLKIFPGSLVLGLDVFIVATRVKKKKRKVTQSSFLLTATNSLSNLW